MDFFGDRAGIISFASLVVAVFFFNIGSRASHYLQGVLHPKVVLVDQVDHLPWGFPKGSVLEGKWDPGLFQENLGWWNMMIWADIVGERENQLNLYTHYKLVIRFPSLKRGWAYPQCRKLIHHVVDPTWNTFPVTNSSYLKIDGWKMNFSFGKAYRKGDVGFYTC